MVSYYNIVNSSSTISGLHTYTANGCTTISYTYNGNTYVPFSPPKRKNSDYKGLLSRERGW